MLAEITIFPFTPHALESWMVIGIILGAIVGGFLFLGGLGVYIWESITGIPGMALEAQVPDEDPERIERHGNL